jgi:hypothetical protein
MQKNLVNCLVDQWKAGRGPLHIPSNDRYKSWAECSALEPPTEPPSLALCRLVDSRLVLPQEVRAKWLRDPVRSNQWREILSKFDAAYSGAAAETDARLAGGAAAPVTTVGSAAAEDTEPAGGHEAAASATGWFPGEPTTFEAVKAQYPNSTSFDHVSGKCFFLLTETAMEGAEDGSTIKKLFLIGKESVIVGGLNDATGFFLGHAAGLWYQQAKAQKFVRDNPGKSFVADWCDDQVLCCLEQNGRDGKPITLRAALQEIERQGVCNFELTGHVLERPPEVVNGNMEDMSGAEWRDNVSLSCNEALQT